LCHFYPQLAALLGEPSLGTLGRSFEQVVFMISHRI
jgi:hypothetical protein